MGKVSIETLCRDVAIVMGECLAEDSDAYESPFPRLKDRVRVVAPGILASLIEESPAEELDGPETLVSAAQADTTGVTEIPLPNDYLRLCAIKMDDWQQSVGVVKKADDENYSRQTSRWTGIRGNPSRPVVAEGITSGGKRCVRLYSSAPGTKLSYALYFSRPDWDASNYMEIPTGLYPVLVEKMAQELEKGEPG